MDSAKIVRLGITRTMKKEKLTQYKVAADSGLKPQVISRFLRGADARLKTLDRICNKGLKRTLLQIMLVGNKK